MMNENNGLNISQGIDDKINTDSEDNDNEYQPFGGRGTCSLPAAKSKFVARGPKMIDGVWKGDCYVIGHSKPLLVNKFFNSKQLSKEGGGKKCHNAELAACKDPTKIVFQ